MKMKVVIIDDEVNIRDTVSEMLQASGYKAFTAADGEDGLVLIRAQRPDIIVCDIMMPGIDGFEVLYRVRNDADLADTPFLFLSAKSANGIVRMAMNLGSDDFVPKPFKATELLSAIETKVNRFKQFKQRLFDRTSQLSGHFGRSGFHELNTPINGIIGAIDFMTEYEREIQEKERLDLLRGMKVSAMRMRRTFTNFMLFFKISEGESVYNTKWTSNIAIIGDQVVDRLLHFYDDIRLPILQLEDARLPMHAQGVELFLFELIDNAIKFGDIEKPAKVIGTKSEDGKNYLVRVEDFGIGMDKQQLENLGRTMKQANRKLHEQEGVGLGLFLAKHVIENAKGSLEIQSRFQKSTVVEVSIPLSE